jgi:hypothetical protein
MKIRRIRFWTAIAAVILYAGPLVYLRWSIREAHFAVTARPRWREINVMDYGARADGVTDDGPAFEAAFSDAARHGTAVEIPRGTYLADRELRIESGMVIRSEGATLKHTDSRIAILSAVSADGWVLEGPLTLVGTRTGPEQNAEETGLSISGGTHFLVEKLTVAKFKGYGVRIEPGKPSKQAAAGRGNHGQFAFVSFLDNSTGLQIDGGTGAEYNLFTLLSFSGNDRATNIAAGNTIITASNIVDNENGVRLSDGPNHGHGIFSAVNINHNKTVNIDSEQQLNGYTFNACHIYGDSSTKGVIRLTGSNGLHFSGGTIAAAIRNDGGGVNVVFDNYSPAQGWFAAAGNNGAAVKEGLIFDDDRLLIDLSRLGAER